jgi:drug/metabolite transporter (DMT)-like permease
MFLTIAAAVLLLVLFGLIVRKRPELGFGIVVGGGLAWAGLALLPRPSMQNFPVWLPALPFAVVALMLFFFGFLAWFWGSDR